MDMQELAIELQNFKQTCQNEAYIKGDFNFLRVGNKSTDFVVKMTINKSWIKSLNSCKKCRCKQAVYTLLNVFYATTKINTRKRVHLFIFENAGQKGDPRLYVVNPSVTANQICNLFYSKDFSVRHGIRNCLKNGYLSEQQIHQVLKEKDKKIISRLIKRYYLDEEFKTLVFSNKCSKFIVLSNL